MADLVWILDSGEVETIAHQPAAPMNSLRPAYNGQVFDDFGIITSVEETPAVSFHRITLRDAVLSFLPGLEGVVLTRDGRIVGETTFNTDPERRGELTDRLGEAARLDAPVLHFTDPWVQNYCHWLCHSLGKVMLAGDGLGADVIRVLPEFSRLRNGHEVGFAEEVRAQTLARFPSLEPRTRLSPGLYRTAELQLLWTNFGHPEFVWVLKGFYAPFQAVGAEVRKGRGNKLLVLRRDDPRMSEADVLAVREIAARFGYTPVHLEGLDFETQLSLFANATHVAGPHGAGFANLVFCQPGTRVLELNKDLDGLGYLRPWFYLLANGAGLEYRYLNRFKGDLAPARLQEAFSRMEDGA